MNNLRVTKELWSTSREDVQSFAINEENGELEEVVYIYREGEPRIPFFGEKARERAEFLANLANTP